MIIIIMKTANLLNPGKVRNENKEKKEKKNSRKSVMESAATFTQNNAKICFCISNDLFYDYV